MKKKLFVFIALFCTFITTGCFQYDDFEDISVHTTVYPLEYIMKRLYGEKSTMNSIYPNGVNPDYYNLSDKQFNEYSQADLFVFNGLNDNKTATQIENKINKYIEKNTIVLEKSNNGENLTDKEKEIVAQIKEYQNLLNEKIQTESDYASIFYDLNEDIKLINANYKMTLNNKVEELWLNPTNYLMLAQNIKDGLEIYITNYYLKNEIDEQFQTLKIELASLDAKMKAMVDNASYKTIVASDDLFKFLEKYNLTVISLEENDKLVEKTIVNVKDLINSKKIKYIYVPNGEELSTTVQNIVDETKVEIVYFNTIKNISEKEREDKKDYFSIMNENIELLKKELNK